jgi:hypothetical protein|tara:strand:+ start:179 stop:445 length:267 start_codon:yes stop_codon:yes gene_type:complete
MKFLFSPFVFILELVSFVIQAAFVYGLVLLAGIIFIVYMINDAKSRKTIIEYIPVAVENVVESTCNRIDGCRVWWDETGKEICPECTK